MMMDHRSRVEILTAILAGSSEDCGVPIAEVMYLSSALINMLRSI